MIITKRLSFFIFLFLIANSARCQHLNQYGHIIPPGDYATYNKNFSAADGKQEVHIGKIVLKGNTAFKTAHGFVSLSGSYENAPSVLRIYSNEGKEIFNRSFNQTINFVMSENGNFCAFHDMKQICLLNLMNQEVYTYQGSNVFAISNTGEVAYYDEPSAGIVYKSIRIISDPVYKILFFKDEPLFITKKTIYRLSNESPQVIFTCQAGRVFDAGVFNERLCISVKKEMPGEFIFNSFCTDDLNVFTSGDEVHYLLKSGAKKKIDVAAQQRTVSRTRSNESILDPLYYYTDSVYQQVGNSYCEMQEYSPGDMYPHPGVDLFGSFMQNVYAVKSGFVKAILTTSAQYHWRIAISNENTTNYTQGYLYAHLEQTSFPYAIGDSVNAGDVIGYLVDFPVAGFVHCHFARIGCAGLFWNGNWDTFDNPLTYMTNFYDSIPPEFEKTINNDVFAFRDINGNYLSPNNLIGGVRVISKVFDRINSSWHCDVNKLRYSLSPLSNPQTMLLDSFSYEYDFYNDEYYQGPYYPGLLLTIYSRDATCFTTADYNIRNFYHIVTSSDGNDTIDGNDSLQLFNTLNFPDDSYIFRVTASDPSGNETSDSMIIEIRNGNGIFDGLSKGRQIRIFPNPVSATATIGTDELLKDASMTVYDSFGRVVRQMNHLSGRTFLFSRENINSGLYFLQLKETGGMNSVVKFVVSE